MIEQTAWWAGTRLQCHRLRGFCACAVRLLYSATAVALAGACPRLILVPLSPLLTREAAVELVTVLRLTSAGAVVWLAYLAAMLSAVDGPSFLPIVVGLCARASLSG